MIATRHDRTDMTTPAPRILVVDDNDDNRYTLTLYLDLEGYRTSRSPMNGEEAVALLETEPFDLVLLDVMMPRLDGYGVLAWLKAKGRLHQLPVIMNLGAERDGERRALHRARRRRLPHQTVQTRCCCARARRQPGKETPARSASRTFSRGLERELEAARSCRWGMLPQSFLAARRGVSLGHSCQHPRPRSKWAARFYDVFRAADGSSASSSATSPAKAWPPALFMARPRA